MDRRTCPYRWCSRIIEPRPISVMDAEGKITHTKVIPQHDIENPVLSGPCIASLMYFPVPRDAFLHLLRTEDIDQLKIDRAIEYHKVKAEQIVSYQDPPQTESQSLRGPGRMGREPDPDSDDWALGGRADEDVRPPDAPPGGTEVPLGVDGHGMGQQQPHHWTGGGSSMGGTAMVSVPEMAAAANAAIAKTQEAFAEAERVKVMLEEARQMYLGLLQNSSSQALEGASIALVNAHSEVQNAMGAMGDSVGEAERFINNLHA